MHERAGVYHVTEKRMGEICWFGVSAEGEGVVEKVSRYREEVERLVESFERNCLSPIHFFEVMYDHMVGRYQNGKEPDRERRG